MPRPRMRSLARTAAFALVASTLALLPRTAAAASGAVTFDDASGHWVLTITDTDAADHNLRVSQASGGGMDFWVIDEQNYDQGARLPEIAPAECDRDVVDRGALGNEEELFCQFAESPEQVLVGTGAGDDVIDYTPTDAVSGLLSGGAGSDLVMGGPGADTLRGDTGTTDQPRDGSDTLDGGCGIDNYYGGGGIDYVAFQPRETTCTAHATGVDASLDDQADDGPENEDIGGLSNSIEGIVGTDGGDLLTGDSADNVLIGNGGDDVIDGLAGPDEVFGGPGADVITGGPGSDTLHGDDDSGSGAGADTIHADDGESDALVDCGGTPGDTAEVDPADVDKHVQHCGITHVHGTARTYDPTVVTDDASLITRTTARFFAEVNAHGTTGGTYFWVISPKFGSTQTQLPDPGKALPADFDTHTASLDVTRLQPGTTYSVYACVTGNKHISCGGTHSFTTTAPAVVQTAGTPPSAVTKVSDALGSNGLATIKVPVTPQKSGQELLGAYTLVKAGSTLPGSSLAKATKDAATQLENGTASLLPPASSLLPPGGATIIGNDGASLITNDGGSLITNDGGSLITNDGGSLITNDGGSRARAPQAIAKKKRTKYLLVLVSYVKKKVTKGRRVVLTLHYTRAGKKILRAMHARNRHLRAHHKKQRVAGFVFDVEFKKSGSKKYARAVRPLHTS